MDTKIIQITSGKGPSECCKAVALALNELLKEANELKLMYEIIEQTKGIEEGTYSSVSIKLKGKNVDSFINSWTGVLLWINQSPYRKLHKRKNWFIGIYNINLIDLPPWNEKDIVYQTMRSSGPGGQNVNKVETAVRAKHISSGIQITINESRSQLQNKKIAALKLQEEYTKWQLHQAMEEQYKLWNNHNLLERGNPKRIYEGSKFTKKK
ncbi:MAG: peptide chain release factor H [Bacteroidota bacterium]